MFSVRESAVIVQNYTWQAANQSIFKNIWTIVWMGTAAWFFSTTQPTHTFCVLAQFWLFRNQYWLFFPRPCVLLHLKLSSASPRQALKIRPIIAKLLQPHKWCTQVAECGVLIRVVVTLKCGAQPKQTYLHLLEISSHLAPGAQWSEQRLFNWVI